MNKFINDSHFKLSFRLLLIFSPITNHVLRPLSLSTSLLLPLAHHPSHRLPSRSYVGSSSSPLTILIANGLEIGITRVVDIIFTNVIAYLNDWYRFVVI